MANKIDSNATGLRFAEEASLKMLPGSPIWYPCEPNSYSDFGGQIKTMARTPISQSRQRQKGTVTDFEASGGFNQDLTPFNSTRLMQGAMFAAAREKTTTASLNAAAVDLGAVVGSAHTIAAASGLTGFLANHLVLTSGFAVTANNGLFKVASASTATLITLSSGLADEANAPADAKVEVVGYEFASATVDITVATGLPRLSRASGAFDLTTLNLVPGEWVYLGSDTASERFANNVGFARVNAVAATYIEFDKTDWTAQAEVGTAKTIRLFFGMVIKNESAVANIKRYTYQVERTLGSDANGVMSEYLVGAVVNEMSISMKQADKVGIDFSFVACDNEQRNGTTGVKAGTRPTLGVTDAYNTSSDFARIKLAAVSASDPAPTALFAFATELSLTVKNNVSQSKALGTLGSFDTVAGIFEVGGKLTAYFADVAAVQAVRNNSDITLDVILTKGNAGFAFDVPLMQLGDGRLSIEKDQAITLPLEINAAASKFDHTFLISKFAYLPTAAM